jgi:uroporphyrinogen-III synthase
VALFRPREDAARTAARLRERGFSVACLPVVAIAPVAAAPRRRRYDAVVATSEKAFLADRALDPASPAFVVGARAARAAEARGFRLGAPPARDAAELTATLERTLPPGATALYLAGRDRKPTLEAALTGRNALEVVEVYAAEARKVFRPAEIRALEGCTLAMHYSRRSAALAAMLAEGAGLSARFRRMTHVCLSEDVARPLLAAGASDVRVAASPDENALIAALVEAAAHFPSRRPSRI